MFVSCAMLDNLGKASSGSAANNLNLALGLDVTAGFKFVVVCEH